MSDLAPIRPARSRAPTESRVRSLLVDEQGAVMVEYVVILGVVSLGVAAAIAGLGPLLLAAFERARGILIAPMP